MTPRWRALSPRAEIEHSPARSKINRQKKMTNKQETKTRKGFFGILRESFSKTGGCCCGPGETCGAPPEEASKQNPKETKTTSKPAPK